MELVELKNIFVEKSRAIFDSTKHLSSNSYGFSEILTRKKLNKAKDKLNTYYSWLNEYDEIYTEKLSLQGQPAEINIRNIKLSVVERARHVFLTSLSSYEKELSNIEFSINFRLSTCIAMLALLISIIGVSAS